MQTKLRKGYKKTDFNLINLKVENLIRGILTPYSFYFLILYQLNEQSF